MQVADRGLSTSQAQPLLFHRFRILKAELLLAQNQPEESLNVLNSPAPVAIPTTPELTAGYLYVRGYALSQIRGENDAKASLEDAREIAEKAGLSALLSTVLVRLGTIELVRGDRQKADEYYHSALTAAIAVRDSYLQARAWEALGYLDLKSARYDECAAASANALTTYKALGAEIRIAVVSVNLGWCDYRLGKLDDARSLFETAQRIFTKHEQWGPLSISLNASGGLAARRWDLPAARSFYEQVIKVATKTKEAQTEADGRCNLTTTLILMGKIDEAETAHKQAQDMLTDRVERETRLRVKLNSGRIAEARGRVDEAQAAYRSVANSGINQPSFLIDADLLLAKLLVAEGRPRDAEKQFARALAKVNDARAELSEDESKLAFSASLIAPFQEFVDFLCKQGRGRDALEIADSSRALLLSERFSAPKSFSGAAAFQKLAQRTKSVLLFYWIAPGQSRLWVITPSTIDLKELPREDEIDKLVDSYSRFIIESRGDPLLDKNSGGELYDKLIGPAAPYVPPETRVIIIPDGRLFDVNFESLLSPGSPRHYWIQDVTVSVAPSLNVLLSAQADSKPEPPRLLLIGDALTKDEKNFPRLANAGKELEDILAKFPSAPSMVRTGADATPESYAACHPEDYSLIHFAAHATTNSEHPLESAVVLSPKGTENMLYAREIQKHPINADLVTISACRSAGAKTFAGEGLVGFAWAFLGAGARNVIAGLWEADDRTTPQLMEAMYRELSRGERPAQALRTAKLELLRSKGLGHKPFYWAPFEIFTVAP